MNFFSRPLEMSWGLMRAAHVRRLKPSIIEGNINATGRQQSLMRGLGVNTVGDLLHYLPFRYEDYRSVTPISRIVGGYEQGQVTMIGTLVRVKFRPTRNPKIKIIEGTLRDASCGERMDGVTVIWFNQPWMMRQLKVGDWMMIVGSVGGDRRPEVRVKETTPRSGPPSTLSPVYPASEAISSGSIATLVDRHLQDAPNIIDPVPARERIRRGYPSKAESLMAIHAPSSVEDAKLAQTRLAWEELLTWEIGQSLLKAENGRRRAVVVDGVQPEFDDWVQSLPWPMTRDQQQACREVDVDLASGQPMSRLLMGDVGAGKTTVALAAMMRIATAGYQAVMLAPTETLAEQHYITLQKMSPLNRQPTLLTGGLTSARRRASMDAIQSGAAGIIVGTHAVLGDVPYRNLALVIIDEQHRFGVAQRAELSVERDPQPHVLHMSATPIPRSLALTVYGDLDVSQLRERPNARAMPDTRLLSTPTDQIAIWDEANEALGRGEQVFVVCPSIEENPNIELAAVTTEFERLSGILNTEVVMLHGGMSSADKRDVMERFAAGEAGAMVATTVIEVGVDVPNATLMVIENAERFGIAQLHQLRGRVGRGDIPGRCVLFGAASNARLKAVAGSTDGFALAEADLRQRGFGDLLGTRQHGLAGFKIAKLPEDEELLEDAHALANTIISDDPLLVEPDHWWLRAEWERSFGDTG